MIPDSDLIDTCTIKADNGTLNGEYKELTLSKEDFKKGFTYDYETDVSQFEASDYAYELALITVDYLENGKTVATEVIHIDYCAYDDGVSFAGYYVD